MIRTLAAALVTSTCIVAVATPAAAQTREYNIRAGSLKTALDAYVRQSGRQVVYRADEVRSARSPGVQGALSSDAALTALLAGSGFTTRLDGKLVAIVKVGNGQGSVNDAPALEESASLSGQDEAVERANDLGVEEIVVTAQKREQRLQDVPISITAMTGEDIAQRGVTSLQDMQYSVPGLSFVRYGPGTVEYVQMRGVANSQGAATVGAYLDEMPITGDVQGNSLDIRLLDMERIEVLRGPQATLYGENSMGGTIRYITASPQFDRIEGAFEGELGSVKDGGWNHRANAMINAPLVRDQIGLRFVAGYERLGGWIDKPAFGTRDENSSTVYTVRGKLGARLGDGLLSVLALHQESDLKNLNFGIDRVSTSPVDQYTRDNYELYQGTLEYPLGAVNVTATTGYLERKKADQTDLTPLLLPQLEAPPPFGLGLPVGFATSIGVPGTLRYTSFSSELRLRSSGSSAFQWMIGGYIRNTHSDTFAAVETRPNALPFILQSLASDLKSNAWSLFGEASHDLSDTLTLLGGVRYYHDRRRFVSNSVNFGAPVDDAGRDTFHTLNPRLNLLYTPSRNSSFYANVSKGFRSGGFNSTTSPNVPTSYQPDSIWTYELGTKQQLLDRKLNFEVALYYSDWKDVQSTFTFLEPGTILLITTNGGKVQGFGFDLTVSARPVTGLHLTATYGWNNLESKTATADKLPGDPTDFAARESWSVSAEYRAPLFGTTEGFARADYQHVGMSQVTLRSIGQIAKFPKRDMVSLRGGVDFGRVELTAFVTNLFDSRVPITSVPFGAFTEETEMQPRTIGLNARLRY